MQAELYREAGNERRNLSDIFVKILPAAVTDKP